MSDLLTEPMKECLRAMLMIVSEASSHAGGGCTVYRIDTFLDALRQGPRNDLEHSPDDLLMAMTHQELVMMCSFRPSGDSYVEGLMELHSLFMAIYDRLSQTPPQTEGQSQ